MQKYIESSVPAQVLPMSNVIEWSIPEQHLNCEVEKVLLAWRKAATLPEWQFLTQASTFPAFVGKTFERILEYLAFKQLQADFGDRLLEQLNLAAFRFSCLFHFLLEVHGASDNYFRTEFALPADF